MKISIDHLKNYIEIPVSARDLIHLMEDIGLEVKKNELIAGEEIFTLELLANRGDHHSYVGIAQEIHGRTGWTKKTFNISQLTVDSDTALADVRTDDCLNYTLTEFVKIDSNCAELTPVQKRIIELSGNNTILPVVDVTNLVGVELGQPLHVFDADKVVGKIIIREAMTGEKARLLFEDKYTDLPSGIMVIADDIKILAIAGVTGCEDSKPTESTKRAYIESATYDPIKVRKAAKILGIQSTSSVRFERGADPSLVLTGAQRSCSLLQQLGWMNIGGIKRYKKWKFDLPSILISMDDLNNYFSTDFTKEFIIDLLKKCDFQISRVSDPKLTVTVPPSRIWDIKNVSDIYEEIAKGVGYNSLPSILPNARGIRPSPRHQNKRNVENFLTGLGFHEVFTDGFYGEKHRVRLGITKDHTLWEHVRTINAESRAYSLLKNNTLAQAIELVQINLSVKNPNIKAFEWTRTFHPNEDAENGLCDERMVLWAIACGACRTPNWNESHKQIDIYYMKGIVEELSMMLGLKLEIRQAVDDQNISPLGTCLHPERRALIYYGIENIGVLGEVHPNTLLAWGLKNSRPCFVELSQSILEVAPFERRYVPPTSTHSVFRDVCLVLPNDFAAGEVSDYMKQQSEWLNDVCITDVYKSEKTNYKNAVTFSFEYNLSKAKIEYFKSEEINKLTELIVSKTLKRYSDFSLVQR